MAGGMLMDDHVFDQRYAEMRSFSAAIVQYQKANKKALLAVQEVSSSIERLVLCMCDMGRGVDASVDAKNVLNAAYNDVAAFKMGQSYLQFSVTLSNHVKRYATALEQGVEKLKTMGKERKSAKEEVDKLTKKRAKDDKYQFKLQEAQQVLMAKESNYCAGYESFTKQRDNYVPVMLHKTLCATSDFTSDFGNTLLTVRDCVSMFLEQRSRAHPSGHASPLVAGADPSSSASPSPTHPGTRGNANGAAAAAIQPVFSNVQLYPRSDNDNNAPQPAVMQPASQFNSAAAAASNNQGPGMYAANNARTTTEPITVAPSLYHYPPTVSTVRGDRDSSLPGTRVQGIPLTEDATFPRNEGRNGNNGAFHGSSGYGKAV